MCIRDRRLSAWISTILSRELDRLLYSTPISAPPRPDAVRLIHEAELVTPLRHEFGSICLSPDAWALSEKAFRYEELHRIHVAISSTQYNLLLRHKSGSNSPIRRRLSSTKDHSRACGCAVLRKINTDRFAAEKSRLKLDKGHQFCILLSGSRGSCSRRSGDFLF